MVFWVFLFQQLLTTILRYASIYKKNGSCLCSFCVSSAPSLFSVEFLCSKEWEKERNVWIFICFGCAFELKRNFEMTFSSNWIHFDCQLPFNRWKFEWHKIMTGKNQIKIDGKMFYIELYSILMWVFIRFLSLFSVFIAI